MPDRLGPIAATSTIRNPSTARERSPIERYAFALAAILAAAVLRLFLQDLYGTHAAFLLFTAAVTVSAWYGGLGPGIVSTLAGGLLGWWLMGDGLSVSAHVAPQAGRLLVYLTIGTVVSCLTGALHRAHAALEQRSRAHEASEQSLLRLLDTAGEGIWTLDPHSRITYVNQRFARMLGYGEQDLLATSALDLLIAGPKAAFAPRLRMGASDQGGGDSRDAPFEVALRRSDGTPLWLMGCTNPILSDSGDYLGSLGMFTDISERHQLEELLRQRNWELEVADRNKDHFLAVLGHELRNPLGPLLHAADILDQAELTEPRQQRAVTTIIRNVKHEARLIDDLLNLTRIARGELLLRFEVVNFAALLRGVVEDHRLLLTDRKLKLRTAIPTEPTWVHGDPTRLVQAVGNLIQNAVKYTDAGGEISIELIRSPDEPWAILRLADNGVGIEPEMLPHVFEAFVQERRSRSRSEDGLGLGLALVRRLVEMHGGSVTADSEGPGCGTRFTVRLPIAAPPKATAPRSGDDIGTAPRRILVIDDDPVSLETMRDLLELLGHEVETSEDGQAGVDRALAFHPEVVLCDLNLPGMDGHQVATMLRNCPELFPLRIVAISGYGAEEEIRRARASGFDDYLVKPVDVDELAEMIDSRDGGPNISGSAPGA